MTVSSPLVSAQATGLPEAVLAAIHQVLASHTEVEAAISIFSHAGFRSEFFQDLRLENKVAESFEFLTGTRSLVQLFLLRFAHRFVFKPVMLIMGDNLECADRTVGMGSIPRGMLMVLRRGLFVGGTWTHKRALGHRSHGDEVTLARRSIPFLNPNSEPIVTRMLGEDGWDGDMHRSIRKGAASAGRELLAGLKMLARREGGSLMPQEAELVFKEVYPALFADPKRDSSVCLRMTQMQLLAQAVFHNCAEQLAYCFRQNLQGARSFIAAMCQHRWTEGTVRCKPVGQQLVVSEINYAHEMALASAVIVLKLREEMLHRLREEIRRDTTLAQKDPLVFLPAFMAETFGAEGVSDIKRFLGISKENQNEECENGQWANHYNHLASLNCFDSAGNVLGHSVLRPAKVQLKKESPVPLDFYLYPTGLIQILHMGFHLWWLRRNTCKPLIQGFLFKWNRVSELPKPLKCYPNAYGPSVRAANHSVSAKRLEQHWAYPALMWETRKQMNTKSLNHYYVLPAFRYEELTPTALMKTAPPHLRALSKELAQCSLMHRLSDTDKELRSVLKEEAFRAIGDNAKRNGGWGNTRHGGEYRRPGHSILDPNTKQGKKTLKRAAKLIHEIGARTGRLITSMSAGVNKCAPRQTARAPRKVQADKARAARRAPPARGCAVAGVGRRGPRAGGRSRRAIGGGSESSDSAEEQPQPKPAADDAGGRPERSMKQGLPSASSDSAGHESDPDFMPGADGLAGLEMVAPRRSKRTAGGGERVGGVGDGSNSDNCGNGTSDGGGLEDDREGAVGAPSAADDDELEGAGDGGDHGGGGSAEGKDIRAGSGNFGDGNAADSDGDLDMPLMPKAAADGAGGAAGKDDDDSDGDLDTPLMPKAAADGAGGAAGKDDDDSDGDLDTPLMPKAAADGAGGAAGKDDDDSDGDLDNPLMPKAVADGAGGAADADADKDDDEPLISNRLDVISSRLGQRQPPAAPGAPDSDDDDTKPPPGLKRLNKEQQKLELNTNIWSFEFAAQCGHLAWYQNNCGAQKMGRQVWLMKQENTAVFSAADVPLQVTITRRASPYLKKLLELKRFKLHTPDDKRSFTVRRDSGRNWYLMYDDFAGVVIVSVEAIFKPVEAKTGNVNEDERWKGTMEYRRIFDTRDSALKSKDKKDSGIYMGAAYFRRLFAEEERASLSQGKKIETFHPGNCVYKGDIRTLVGIVRWLKDKDVEVSNDYFTEYLDADLFRLGAYVNQNLRQ
jgi:hypothetical protein